MQTKIIERYFFFALLVGTLIFAFFVFRPFWVVFVLGISFSVILYPIFKWLKDKKLPGWLASLTTLVLFVIVLCGPVLAIGAVVFEESKDIYFKVASIGNTNTEPILNSINEKINRVLPGGVNFDVKEKAIDLISYVTRNVASVFGATLSAFFSFVLMLVLIFFFLKDGAEFKKSIVAWSPLADTDDEKIISRLTLSVNAVVKGYLLLAVIQGTLVGLGFWIFGVPHAAFWGVVAAVCSLIPMLGTALVSAPAVIFLFATGNTAPAIGLLIWAAVIVGMIDNFLNPLFVGKRINIPPFLILMSVLGGISLLGPIGILVGPLTLSLLETLISIYRNEFSQSQ